MPGDFGDSTLNSVRVLEDHDSLGGDRLRHELWVFTLEVLFEEIDLVVLLNAAGCSLDEFTSGLTVAESGLFDELSHVLVDFVRFLVVVLLRPSTNVMRHTVVFGRYALSIDAVLRHLGDIV